MSGCYKCPGGYWECDGEGGEVCGGGTMVGMNVIGDLPTMGPPYGGGGWIDFDIEFEVDGETYPVKVKSHVIARKDSHPQRDRYDLIPHVTLNGVLADKELPGGGSGAPHGRKWQIVDEIKVPLYEGGMPEGKKKGSKGPTAEASVKAYVYPELKEGAEPKDWRMMTKIHIEQLD